MRDSNISVGIDIGNTKVVTCVGKLEAGNIDILGIGSSVNQGIRKGVIVDVDETVSAISASLENAERTSGYQIDTATLGISGAFIESEISRGVIAVSKQDGEISSDDVMRSIEAAKAIPSKPNREILHILPLDYTIDSNETVKDPTGMTGIRLEVNANIISASTNAVRSYSKAIEQSGLGINDLVFSPLATAKLLLSKRQTDIGVMLVDIGACTTSYGIFENGDMITAGVIPVGSMHITNDIAIGLRTDIDVADQIKIKRGFAQPDKVADDDEIDLSKFDKNEEGKANAKYVAEIIEARLNEIFSLIKDYTTRKGYDLALPAGIVLTGGGAKLNGLIEMVKDNMRLPAQIGRPVVDISGLIDKLDDPIYSTSIGLMLWGKDKVSPMHSSGIDIQNFGGIVDKVKSIFKNVLP